MKILIIILVTLGGGFAANYVSWRVMLAKDRQEHPEPDDSGLTPRESLNQSTKYSTGVIKRAEKRDKKSAIIGGVTAVVCLVGSITFFSIRDKKKAAKG